jgi:hypothetical protein
MLKSTKFSKHQNSRNMKTIYFKFFFPVVILLLISCGDDFLDKKPLGKLTTANFFETEDHAILATNALYEHMRSWEVHVFSYIGMTDIVSDDADKGSFANDAAFLGEIDDFTFNASNLAPLTVWQGYYQGIFRANNAIENIPPIDMNNALRDRLVAECKFFRAYFYLNLVRWFGDIPLITHPLDPSEFSQQRAPVADIYAQIEQDLTDASAVLPEKSQYSSADLGRVTKGSARGLLARAHLAQGDFANTEKYALEVINSGQYALYPSYLQLFQLAGEHSSESVFEIGSTTGRINSSQYNQVQGARGTPNLGWGFNRPSNNLVSSYEQGDPRRDATILYPGETLPDGSAVVEDNPDLVNERYNQKAWVPLSPSGDNFEGQGNLRLIRYADVLLMAAEALNENNNPTDALVYLNMVRARARGTSMVLLPNVTTTDKNALRTRIWNERRSELAMEQIRWFDLLRQGRAEQVMTGVGKNFVSPKHLLFPIPQVEIDLSGGTLQQNVGY